MTPVTENTSKKPRYAKVKEELRKKILTSGFEDDRLPSEHTMAKTFGVSYMTIRRAVGELIDEGLLVRETGRGTFIARAGRADSTHLILLSLPEGMQDGICNPYYAQIFAGLEETARIHGYRVILSNVDLNVLVATRSPKHILPLRVDGMVMPIGGDIEHIRKVNIFTPVVLLGDWYTGHDLPRIAIDSYKGGLQAMDHLIELGHRQIGMAAYTPELQHKTGRAASYFDRMAELGMQPDPQWLEGVDVSNTHEDGMRAAGRILSRENRPTAVVCHNDMVALGFMKQALSMGLRVPEDISIVGFDDIPLAYRVYPELSTVHIPKRTIGRLAFELLIKILAGTRIPDPVIEVETGFIARQSSAPLLT